MPTSEQRMLKDIVRAAESQGWVLKEGRKHTKLLAPTGGMVVLPVSPSDGRSVANALAIMRRYGFNPK